MTTHPVAAPVTILRAARESAFPAGDFVGQESFMGAREILALARRAGIRRGASVLDLCCGVGGPGLHVTRELGCTYLGVDSSPQSVRQARLRAEGEGLDARFEVATVPPVPTGRFDVILLLETLLAFPDKADLLQGISRVLHVGGRFAFTVEEGAPLTEAERGAMPRSDTVWPIPFGALLSQLEGAGLRVTWLGDCSASHLTTAEALGRAYAAVPAELATVVGNSTVEDLVTAHRLWGQWLRSRRIRKLAVVAERVPG